MTGRELIDWIHENKAEEMPIIFFHGCYDGEDAEADKPEIERIRDNDIYVDRSLRGKNVIRLN
jgi:hypothetical protein